MQSASKMQSNDKTLHAKRHSNVCSSIRDKERECQTLQKVIPLLKAKVKACNQFAIATRLWHCICIAKEVAGKKYNVAGAEEGKAAMG